MSEKKFIQGAIKHPGALHKQMGVPEGKPIPAGKLEKAAHAGGKLGQRARFAETLKGLHHSGPEHAEVHQHGGSMETHHEDGMHKHHQMGGAHEHHLQAGVMHVHHKGGEVHIHHADGKHTVHVAPDVKAVGPTGEVGASVMEPNKKSSMKSVSDLVSHRKAKYGS